MSHVQTRFSPADHGFRFINRFELNLPVKFTLPLVGPLDLSRVVFGLCGGMCFSALDYFYNEDQPPQDSEVDRIDNQLFVYLCERQLDSLRIPVVLKVLEWMLISDQEIRKRMSRNEQPRLRKQLDRGEPVVLALIRARGGEDPTQNHQVLATGYSLDADTNTLTIELYDPNHPGKDPTLDLRLPRQGETAGPGWITQSTGEALRGFFVISYKRQSTPPRVTRPGPGTLGLGEEESAPLRIGAAVDTGFRLSWPVDSRRVTQEFGKNPHLYKGFGLPGHEGLDLLAPSGANIYASADGEVYQANHPDNHAYGLQVRIKHAHGGKIYHTIYAHLSRVLVSPGQQVKAGDRIGLADNTGNSFGDHLHLTLKIEGAQTPGYPKGIVDPLPYLTQQVVVEDPVVEEPVDLPPSSGVTVYTTNQLNLRARPDINAPVLALLASGEALDALGKADEVRSKVGQPDAWLPVRTAAGRGGYVAAWLVQTIDQSFPPSDLVVYTSDFVNLRSGPGPGFGLIGTVPTNTALTVLGDAEIARGRIGRQGEWIQVQTENGMRGFVAAWLVHLTGGTPKPSGLMVQANQVLNLRARPSTDANVLAVLGPGEGMNVLGEMEQALAAIGQMERWLNVETSTKLSGFVAAWMVSRAGGNGQGDSSGAPALTVFPTADVNLRVQASVNSPRVSGAFRNEALQVLDDNLDEARGKIGKQDAWLYTQKKNGKRGWVAAQFLSATQV
jgi:murein DD-endopeptidase MepM/ murein hydrolase activator NlpD/uncharacterized protein YgiM (DUF1202 family)